jgi:WD40 repeat protein
MSPQTTVLSLALCLCALPAVAAAQESDAAAYVYVAGTTKAGANYIDGYYASSTGALTAMPGSPYAVAKCKVAPYCAVGSIALNGKWLFGSDGYDIDVFSMASDGALKQTATHQVGILDTSHNPPIPAGGPESVFLDHTGASLYDGFININGSGNNGYQAYRIDQQNGQISLINQIQSGPEEGSTLAFTGNNKFAFSSSCYHGTPDIYGYQRTSDGGLAPLNENPPFPKPWTGNFYCPYLAAADPTNHLAVAVQPTPDDEYQGTGPYQLASYTVNGSTGAMTTTSTYANMPSAKVGQPYVYWLSPDGKYLAVGGATGLQVFHFNGAAPLTAFTGLLTGDAISQLWWDNAGHLYAMGQTDNKLFVFTVMSSGAKAAPGSPHAVAGAAALMVMSK